MRPTDGSDVQPMGCVAAKLTAADAKWSCTEVVQQRARLITVGARVKSGRFDRKESTGRATG